MNENYHAVQRGPGEGVLPTLQEHRKRMSALLRFFENWLTKPKAAILIPDSPESSGAIKGSDCGSAPSSSALGVAGAQDGLHGPSTTRVTYATGMSDTTGTRMVRVPSLHHTEFAVSSSKNLPFPPNLKVETTTS